MTKNHVDIWFCVDVLFSSYKTLIVLYQSKICTQGPILPSQAVEISRKSVNLFQSLLETSGNAFWGVRYVSNFHMTSLVVAGINLVQSYIISSVHSLLHTLSRYCRESRTLAS